MASVVEVCDYHGPYPGNFIPSLLATGEAVRGRLGLEYRCLFPEAVAARPWVQLVREAGIVHAFLPAAGGPARLRALRAFARDAGARLLRSHFTAWDLDAALAGRSLGARVLWNIHSGTLHYGVRQRSADLVKVRALGPLLCDRVVVVSEEIGREARMRGFPERKVSVVLNGIDVGRFEPGRLPEREAARAALGLEAEARVVLAFGWSPYRKGADVVARAGALLAARDRSLAVVLVGGDELRAALRQHAGDPLPPWLRVAAPVDDVGVLFAAADVFVSASRKEGLPYAIGEAMAAGLPVASSAIPASDVYFGAAGVRTYPVEDPAALAAMLGGLLAPAARESLAAPNRAYVAERLGLERHVDGVVDVFARELHRARRRR
jgi:glycosyltransferase involved in cell wall biosynthesis